MHKSSNSALRAHVPHSHAARRTPLALALAVVLGMAPLAASAATLKVDNSGDTGSTMTCTLRQAMTTLNNGATAGSDEGSCRANATGTVGVDDTILFDAAVFPAGASNTITLAGSALHASIATDVTIDATVNSHVTIDADHLSGVMTAGAGGATLTLKHLTLTHGNVTTANCYSSNSIAGGGLCTQASTVVLIDSAVTGNTAQNGGGIAVYKGALTLTRSTVSGNTAQGLAGGVLAVNIPLAVNQSTIDNNVAGLAGGGIMGVFCEVSMTDSTLSGNKTDPSIIVAPVPGAPPIPISGGVGGAIFLSFCPNPNVLTNSTITGNSAPDKAGGIYIGAPAKLELHGVTLTDNSSSSGGGIYVSGSATLTSFNSIVANNADNDIVGSMTPDSVGNLVGAVPGLNLGPLADNGGPTWTMMPLPGSVAIDSGDNAHCQATDQRGYLRPNPGSTSATPCDIGAVEANSISDEIFKDGFDP